MSIETYDATALLALPQIKPGSTEEAGLLSWSRPYLIGQIRAEGVDVNVVRGPQALHDECDYAHLVVRPEYSPDTPGVSIARLGSVSLDSYGVVRSITRAVSFEHTINTLNPSELRNMAKNKFKMANDILQPLHVYGRNVVHALPFEALQLDALKGDTVVAKPNNGRLSRGIEIGTKSTIQDTLRHIETPYIVEETLDFSLPLPSVKGINETEQARLDEANRTGVNKEIRMFFFGNDVWDVTGRIAKPGEADFRDDKWLYIDPETVPAVLLDKSREVVGRLKDVLGTDEFNIAIDWVYATSASEPEPSWRVMEVNAAEPQLVQLHQNDEIGKRQHDKLANQIVRIAVS